jgi:hypothetical protein
MDTAGTVRLYYNVRFGVALFTCVWAVFGVGCQGAYNRAMSPTIEAYVNHDFAVAAQCAAEQVTDLSDRNALLSRLEYASTLRAANAWEASNTALQEADDLWEEGQAQADLDISDESFATITKLSMLPYRGRAYDGIMMNLYMALNYLALGELDSARVQIDRAYFRQQDAVARNAKHIEKAQEAAQQAAADEEAGYDVQRAQEDERFNAQRAEAYADLEQDVQQYAAYANYVNPYAQFLRGLFLMSCGYDASDAQNAKTIFSTLTEMVPDPTFVLEDMAVAESVARGGTMPATTYVILETGRAPTRESIRIDLPVFVAGKYSGGVDYVGAAFPRLKKQETPECYRKLVVTGDGQTYTTRLLCSMDGVIGQDFKNELPQIITRTLLSTGVKAAAAYGISEATEGEAVTNAVARIVATGYQVYMNEADVRTWLALPKEIQYCRLATPTSGYVTLQCPDGISQQVEVNLAADVNLIFVKSVRAGLSPSIHRITFPQPTETVLVTPQPQIALKGVSE